MLRSKLWTGLKDERDKNNTRYKYDQIHDFDILRAELRAAEQEVWELDIIGGRLILENAEGKTCNIYATDHR
jgi:hypothetical protein